MKVFVINNCFESEWNGGNLSHQIKYTLIGPENFNIRKIYADYKKATGHYALGGFVQYLIDNHNFEMIPHKETFFYHGKTDNDII